VTPGWAHRINSLGLTLGDLGPLLSGIHMAPTPEAGVRTVTSFPTRFWASPQLELEQDPAPGARAGSPPVSKGTPIDQPWAPDYPPHRTCSPIACQYVSLCPIGFPGSHLSICPRVLPCRLSCCTPPTPRICPFTPLERNLSRERQGGCTQRRIQMANIL